MNHWKLKSRPVCLEKRFEFQNYQETRDFLDHLGALSERIKRYPDISFGKTYVNITLRPEDDSKDAQIASSEHDFANEIDKFIS